ncbi:MAG: hypothetical protein JSW43_09980 [Gemmatimonadota bacterium]|nr:MAG: hypothetical protein JSW43_09980 [Gemmatimonadota bacterium]
MKRLSIALAATLVLGGDLLAQAVPEGAQATKVPMAYRRTPQLRVDPFRHVMIPHWGLVISGGGLAGNNTVTIADARAMWYLIDNDAELVGDALDLLSNVPDGDGFRLDAEAEGGVYLGGPFGRHFSLGISAKARSYGIGNIDDAAVSLLRDGNVARQNFDLGNSKGVALGTEEFGAHGVIRLGPIASEDGVVLTLGGGARLVKPVFYYAATTTLDSRLYVASDSVAAAVTIDALASIDVDFSDISLGSDLVADFMVRLEWPTSGIAFEAMFANFGSVTVENLELQSKTFEVNSTYITEVLDSLETDFAVTDTVSVTVKLPRIIRFAASAWANRFLQIDVSARLKTTGTVFEYPFEGELGTTWRLIRQLPLRVGLIVGGAQDIGFSGGLGLETRNLFFSVAGRSIGGFLTEGTGVAGRLELGFFF